MSSINPSANKGCLGTLLGLFGIHLGGDSGQAGTLPYLVDPQFMSPAELSFYRVLKSQLAGRYEILVKVGLGDLFRVTSKEEWRTYRNKIDRKHVDFLLCDPVTMVPKLAIELDDGSHLGERRKERDAFVNQVFSVAGLPLRRMPVMRAYSAESIEVLVAPIGAIREPETETRAAGQGLAPMCPNCGVEMILRVATKGKHKGRMFYGCPNYPNCRKVLPVPGE